MKLYAVKINTYKDSCKTYALKRIGLESLVTEDDSYTVQMMCEGNYFQKIDTFNTPEIGDILVWIHKPNESYYIPQEITKEGIILCNSRIDYGHCGVYEGNGLTSDCMWEQEWGQVIRMRRYSELRTPDFILRQKPQL